MFFDLNVQSQPFYSIPEIEVVTNFDKKYLSYENTVLFMVSNFQYLFCCLSFSIGKPYRLPMYYNWAFCIAAVGAFTFDTVLVFTPDSSGLANFFDFRSFEKDGVDYYEYRYKIYVGCMINCVLTYVFEVFVVNNVQLWNNLRVILAKEEKFKAHLDHLSTTQSLQEAERKKVQ